ncbi:transcriptional regulator, PadR-like family [Mycolicibacterium rhodesiae JS60]|nr:transcriptional regulator, PadR-like family [Mycolicibacterium rhodesiae JS60]
MSLRSAILTALIERPSSGKELARRFDLSFGYFWHATHQQIYRELGQMSDAGLIQLHSSQEKGRGGPRTYDITEAGVQHLRDWVATTSGPVPIRDPLLVRLRAAAALGDIDLTDQVQQHLDHHRALLETYRGIEQRDFSRPLRGRRQRLQYLILQAGINTELSWAQWCTDALKNLVAERGRANRRRN